MFTYLPVGKSNPGCSSSFITDEKAEKYLKQLINYLYERLAGTKKRKEKETPFDHNQTIFIIHRFTELLKKDPVMLEIPVEKEDDLVIIGDLNGHSEPLLHVLQHGLPSERRYLFLGNYIGKGGEPLETILLVMLLKIRWPQRVFTLRGCQELYETCRQEGFIKLLRKKFPFSVPKMAVDGGDGFLEIAFSFQLAFDWLPISAIVDDKILCVHGGPSQWMSSRDVLKKLERPTTLMFDVRQRALLADALWADADPQDETKLIDGRIVDRYFTPSRRGVGFEFSRRACVDVLKDLNCSFLIRSHQSYETGFSVTFPKLCYSLKTAPTRKQRPEGTHFVLSKTSKAGKEKIKFFVNWVQYVCHPHVVKILEDLAELEMKRKEEKGEEEEGEAEAACYDVGSKAKKLASRALHKIDKSLNEKPCRLCKGLKKSGATSWRSVRAFNHKILVDWMIERPDAPLEFLDPKCVLSQKDTEKLRVPMVVFPLALDLATLGPGRVSRRFIPEIDWELMQELFPDQDLPKDQIDFEELNSTAGLIVQFSYQLNTEDDVEAFDKADSPRVEPPETEDVELKEEEGDEPVIDLVFEDSLRMVDLYDLEVEQSTKAPPEPLASEDDVAPRLPEEEVRSTVDGLQKIFSSRKARAQPRKRGLYDWISSNRSH